LIGVVHPAPGLDYAGALLGESVEAGGRGVIMVHTNAGGQGSHGLGREFQRSLNEIVDRLHDIANGDRDAVAFTGGSRGGSNSLFHGARPNRSYRTRAAFAGVPPTHFGALATAPLNLFPLHSFLNLPNFEPTSILGDVPFERYNDLSAIGQVDHWDRGAWVELCGGPRDWTGGAGIAVDYIDALPDHVSSRLNYIYGSGHGGNGVPCGAHLRLFVLDELAGNAGYQGRFRSEVAEGVHHYRLRPGSSAEPFPATDSHDYEVLTTEGCGERIPVSLALPFQQQLTATTFG
jgi:hypothetical protein